MGKQTASVSGANTAGRLADKQFLVTVVENEGEAWGPNVPDMFGVIVQQVEARTNRPNGTISEKRLMLCAVSELIGEIRLEKAGQEAGRMPLHTVRHDPTGRGGDLVSHERFDRHYLSSEESLEVILAEVANMIARTSHPEVDFHSIEPGANPAANSAANS